MVLPWRRSSNSCLMLESALVRSSAMSELLEVLSQ